MHKRRRVADAQAEASRAEYHAQVAEAKAKHYSPSKAGTTSQGTNIAAQALTTTPMGAPIPPPTHPAVAEALHQQSLALGIAPDPQGQVPLAPAPPVPALAPPVTTLLAPVGASPGPPGVADALGQQSLALGIAPDPQGQVPLAPAPLVLAIAALAPPVTTLPAPVRATPGPPGVAEVVRQQPTGADGICSSRFSINSSGSSNNSACCTCLSTGCNSATCFGPHHSPTSAP
jgi:hypothetical protein